MCLCREKRCRLCWERFRRDCRPRAAKLLSGEMALSNLPTRSSSSSSSITPSRSRAPDISSTAPCKERRMLPTHPDTCVCASDSLLPKNCIFFHPIDEVCWESQGYLAGNYLFFGKKIPDIRSRGRYSWHALASPVGILICDPNWTRLYTNVITESTSGCRSILDALPACSSPTHI